MTALVLPILLPLSTAAVLMLAPKRGVPQRWISLAGTTVTPDQLARLAPLLADGLGITVDD